MSKMLLFASWNVKHFSGKKEQVKRVVSLLNSKDPDVFALYEVRDSHVFPELMNEMTGHSFSITKNQVAGDMEILVGVRRTLKSFSDRSLSIKEFSGSKVEAPG